ncbi:hypothetical protein R3P38DRAFT_2781489 [Favolaschia claudopus]|uniref:Uncharacterized protein n=1 Tax=Favolaschia claudopus TaxID=2862362 RepID=A0AAW0B445_9AGAR
MPEVLEIGLFFDLRSCGFPLIWRKALQPQILVKTIGNLSVKVIRTPAGLVCDPPCFIRTFGQPSPPKYQIFPRCFTFSGPAGREIAPVPFGSVILLFSSHACPHETTLQAAQTKKLAQTARSKAAEASAQTEDPDFVDETEFEGDDQVEKEAGTKENTGDCLLQLGISSHELDLVHRLAHLQGKIKYLTNIGPMYTLEAHKRSDSLSRPSLRDLHFKQNPQAYWARHELSIISLGITSTSHHPKIFWPSALSQSSNLVAPIQVILLLHCKNPTKTSIEHFYDVWATVITTSVLVAPGPL